MRRERAGATEVLEAVTEDCSVVELNRLLRRHGFARLELCSAPRLQAAALAWRLGRLGAPGETLTAIQELARLPNLDLLLAFLHDLAVRPPRPAWLPGHPLRVARLADLFGQRGLPSAACSNAPGRPSRLSLPELDGLWVGALVHDFGKLLLPDDLLRPRLTLRPEQRLQLQEHCQIGYEGLRYVNWPWPEVLGCVRAHHEHWDGSGYPQGLQGEEIPLSAQLIALADYCDTLLREQPERPAWPPDEVARLLQNQSGRAFSPPLVEAALALWPDVLRTLGMA